MVVIIWSLDLQLPMQSPLRLWFWILLRWGVLDTTLCNKVCQWLAKGLWFSLGTPMSPTNKTDRHNITEILLKVALNTINQTRMCIKMEKIKHFSAKINKDYWWFSRGTPVSSTNKTDCHDITEILLKVVLNTITINLTQTM